MTNPDKRSLYERLGGYDVLAAAVDDLLPRLHGDAEIGVLLERAKHSHKEAQPPGAVGFPGSGAWWAGLYTGLDMNAAHQGLDITERDWAVLERHVVAVLDKFGVQGQERADFLAAAASLKSDVVQAH